MLYLRAPTGPAGLFAVDAATGKLRWTFRPAAINGSVSTLLAIVGTLVIAPYGAANAGAVIAVSAATGKEVWRAVDHSVYSAVVAEGERVFVVSRDCTLYALGAANGQEQWNAPLRFVPGGACTTSPVVRDGTVYAQIVARAPEGSAGCPIPLHRRLRRRHRTGALAPQHAKPREPARCRAAHAGGDAVLFVRKLIAEIVSGRSAEGDDVNRAAPRVAGARVEGSLRAPRLPCAVRDRSATSIRETLAQTVTTALRERRLRRNVRVSGAGEPLFARISE